MKAANGSPQLRIKVCVNSKLVRICYVICEQQVGVFLNESHRKYCMFLCENIYKETSSDSEASVRSENQFVVYARHALVKLTCIVWLT